MAKSLRSKRKRKLRAVKRERLRVKEKERLEMILGVKGKDKEMKDVVVSRPDGSRIKIPVAVETMEEGEDDETVVESENNEGLKTTAFTQESGDALQEDVDMKPQQKIGKKALKRVKGKQALKRLGAKKKKGRKMFKW